MAGNTDPMIRKATAIVAELNEDEAERMRAHDRWRFLMDQAALRRQSEAQGYAKGRGEVAKRLKNRGRPLSEIAEDTGLDIAVIREL
jgi:hypothetical protein